MLSLPPPHNLLWDPANRLTIARVTRMVDPAEGSVVAVAMSVVLIAAKQREEQGEDEPIHEGSS